MLPTASLVAIKRLKTYDINALLNDFVALTRGRDEATIASKLIEILTGLTTSAHGKLVQPIAIYQLNNAETKAPSKFTASGIEQQLQLADDIKGAIFNCFKTAQIQTHTLQDNRTNQPSRLKFYPIKNYADKVSSVVEIHTPAALYSQVIDLELETSIRKTLNIYQNFSRLINDNESDTLTGLLNRKTFDYKINKIIAQMQAGAKRKDDRNAGFYSLAIFDIDHFKRVNDNFGHLIGDEVLLLFSQHLKQSFRDSDPLFRFGGEEFVGVFGCNGPDDINAILERFRKRIGQYHFPQVGHITVSTGFTQITEFDTSSQVIDRADSALYFAKNNGRNRVESYDQLLASGKIQVNKKEGDIELF